MKRLVRATLPVVLLMVAYLLCCDRALFAQQTDKLAIQTTTQERLETEPWWPTMSTVPLQSFAGSETCVQCHRDVAPRGASAMQHAAVTGKDATFLRGKPGLTFHSAALVYYLTANADGMDYAVTEGGRKLASKLDWVMGAGSMGRTFVYQTDGHWFQSQVTVYSDHGELDTTTGLKQINSSNLMTSLGQPLTVDDTRRCFGCHTVHATTPSGFNPLHAEAGLGCEACHGPGLAHVKQMNAAPAALKTVSSQASAGQTAGVQTASAGQPSTIFDPGKLSPVDSIDFCGSCHRTFVDATSSMGQTTGTAVVRFQPYRLEQSKCWRVTQDERLTCVACHNPHEALNRDPVSYDKHCTQCHSSVAGKPAEEHAGKVCPKATSQCVTCHMPKVPVVSMHGDFTDHRIRIAKAGEPFPQ